MPPTIPSPSHRSTPATPHPDSPSVRIPPPFVYLVAFLIGLLLQVRVPLPILPSPVGLGIGGVLLVGGALLVATSIPTMLRRGGTLNTNAASRRLVTTGVYRVSRNPMYLALVLLYSGLACVYGSTWALLLLLLLLLYTRFLVIAREERFLEGAFGDAYRRYKAGVRRWL
jgi:protein-S-isoprenylcysteine O-methyltransferase Ste14